MTPGFVFRFVGRFNLHTRVRRGGGGWRGGTHRHRRRGGGSKEWWGRKRDDPGRDPAPASGKRERERGRRERTVDRCGGGACIKLAGPAAVNARGRPLNSHLTDPCPYRNHLHHSPCQAPQRGSPPPLASAGAGVGWRALLVFITPNMRRYIPRVRVGVRLFLYLFWFFSSFQIPSHSSPLGSVYVTLIDGFCYVARRIAPDPTDPPPPPRLS